MAEAETSTARVAVARRAPATRRRLRLVNDFLNGLAGNGLGRRRQHFDPRGTRGGGLGLRLGCFQRGGDARQFGHHC